MATAVYFYRTWALPWQVSAEQEQRFRRIVRQVFSAVLALAVIFTFLPLPESDPDETPEVPPRLARLLLEKPAPPPPPPVAPPRREEITPPKPREVRQPEVRLEAPPVDRRQQAREKAAVAGLLPFADALAELRDNKALAGLGNDRPLTGAVGDGPRVERSLITSKAGRSSGGINTSGFSRDTGGMGLGGRGTTQVTSTLGGMAGGGSGAGAGAGSGPGGKPSRSREEIEMVFDQNKGAIYALYSRALRRDPTLQGKLVLRLTIEPSGVVSVCEVVSSELADQDLLQKLVQRVRMFRFLDKDVATVTTTKPIDFFPA